MLLIAIKYFNCLTALVQTTRRWLSVQCENMCKILTVKQQQENETTIE